MAASVIRRKIGCDDKVKFPTWGHAAKAAKKMRRSGENVEEYRCGNCGKFHVGHPTAESVRTRRQGGRLRVAKAKSFVGDE